MKLVSRVALVALVLALTGNATAQKKTTKTAVSKNTPSKPVTTKRSIDEVADEKKVRDMVGFLEYMLNTLGSSGTPTRDKEVLITESYSKIFRDSKVQIEDDLDEDRVVITNK